MTKDFHIGAILSVVGNKLIAPNKIGDVYEVMNWLTGESLYTHQLVTAHDECRTELLRQHPQLVGYDDSSITGDNWRGWLAAQVEKYGVTLPVVPLPKREPKYDTPIGDLVEMLGGDTDKIMVVEP